MSRYYICHLLLLSCLALFGAAGPAFPAHRASVEMPAADDVKGDAPADARDALLETIRTSWTCYLKRDTAAYGDLLGEDVVRQSQRAAGQTRGRAAALAGLRDEWRAFEKNGTEVAESMTVTHLEISAGGDTATALYRVACEGGTRWGYSDDGLVFQAFRKIDGRWRIAHQIDGWSLDFDARLDRPGEADFTFDFVHPVADLDRAVRFYAQLLGEPGARSADRAWFDVGGTRFVLDCSDLAGRARIRPGAPAGYAQFHVKGLDAEVARLAARGTEFVGTPSDRVRRRGPDRYALGLDPSGNVFVLLEEGRESTANGTVSAPTGFDGTIAATATATSAAANVASAWLAMDAARLSALHESQGRWFDATAVRTRPLEPSDRLERVLPTYYWSRYDRSPSGIAARWEASDVVSRPLGERTLVAYTRTLVGTGAHPFRERAYVTHVFGAGGKSELTLIVPDVGSSAEVLALDYTGYGVTDLREAERFYTGLMDLGDPYEDDRWRGYWSHYAVFGLFTADPEVDALPRPGATAGYVSFWVKSAREAEKRLAALGSKFPVIPAIHDKAGVVSAPGYEQILGTDSEGNAVLFTEYTGRRR